jgi:hypothetical protein
MAGFTPTTADSRLRCLHKLHPQNRGRHVALCFSCSRVHHAAAPSKLIQLCPSLQAVTGLSPLRSGFCHYATERRPRGYRPILHAEFLTPAKAGHGGEDLVGAPGWPVGFHVAISAWVCADVADAARRTHTPFHCLSTVVTPGLPVFTGRTPYATHRKLDSTLSRPAVV